MSFVDEIKKIPPVTRFLCGSTLAVTLPVVLQLLPIYTVVFVRQRVTSNFELWRPFTSFFYGGSGLALLFDFFMLYRNSDQLESSYFPGRSADYAWQLLCAAASILTLNIPLGSFFHFRPLLVCLTYLTSRLAPPGTQTSLFGVVNIPLVYFPYALIGMDLIMAGPSVAATSVTGAIVGHLWWWGVYETRALEGFGRAPGWLRALVGNNRLSGSASGGNNGVHVIPPRRLREETTGIGSGYRWGSGQRLGGN